MRRGLLVLTPIPRALALVAWLAAAPHSGFSAGNGLADIRCVGRADALAGRAAAEGARYRLGGDVVVGAPAGPSGWTVMRCVADEVSFLRTDAGAGVVVTASVSRATVGPWRDERAFADDVRAMFQRGTGDAPQHMTTDAVAATRVANRPCVDLRRSGVVTDETNKALDGPHADPLAAREIARVCHLLDPAHPRAAVLAIVKLSAAKDPGTLAATAQAFLAGIALPPRR